MNLVEKTNTQNLILDSTGIKPVLHELARLPLEHYRKALF